MNVTNNTLGILQLDTKFPRIRGDVCNSESYSFPILVRVIPGANVQRVVIDGDTELLKPFLEAAKELENQGVFAITTSCGFLAPFQKYIAATLNIPIFLSSLIQITLAYTTTQRRVGVVTANSNAIKERHFRGASVPEFIPLAIRGLQNKPSFAKTILEDDVTIDPKQIEMEVLETAQELLTEYPDIGAIVFECHNLAPYAPIVAKETQKPVFDIITFANWIYSTMIKNEFL